MNVILYARVSSEKQAEKDLSIKAQVKELNNYALKHSYNVIDIFIDEAKSARSANRPAFQNMISLAKQKNPPFEAILVWKLSRFARNREDSILYKSLLKKKGIQVISINEQIDDSPVGKMLEGILEVVDEFYSNNMAVDIKRGMKENASRGFFNGGIIPLGYKIKKIKVNNNDKSKLEIDDETAQIVKKIFELYISGEGAKEIAKYLNANYSQFKRWKKNNVLEILRNEIYIGNFLWNRESKDDSEVIRVLNCHPAIITNEVFNKVQNIISSKNPTIIHPRTIGTKNLLNGLLFCSKCNKAYTSYSAKSGKYNYYTCQNHFKSVNGVCNQKEFNINKLDAIIVNLIKDRIITEDNIKKLISLVNEELVMFKKEYNSNLTKLDNLIEVRKKSREKLFKIIESTEDLNITDFAPRIKELNSEIEKLEKDKLELQFKLDLNGFPKVSEKDIKPYVRDLQNTLKTGSIVEQKAFLRSFINKIIIDNKTATIEYTFPVNKQGKNNQEVLALAANGSA